MYPRRVWTGRSAAVRPGRFLLMHEEPLPPGAACGGPQGAQQAGASVALQQPGAQCASSGLRFRVALLLRCTPGGAGWRDPLAHAEMRLRECWVCAGTSAGTVAMRSDVPVCSVQCPSFRVIG